MKLLLLIILLSPPIMSIAQVYNMELKDLDGNNVMLGDQRGERFTVVDFWASWCKPCLSAMPKLQQLSEKYKGTGVVFWGINVDSPRNQVKVKPLVRSLGLSYPVFTDMDQELMNELNVIVLPTLVILDAKGKIRFLHEGYQLGDEQLIDESINNLLTGKP